MRCNCWVLVQEGIACATVQNAMNSPVQKAYPMMDSRCIASVFLFENETDAIDIAADRNKLIRETSTLDKEALWIVQPVTVVFLDTTHVSNRKLPGEKTK